MVFSTAEINVKFKILIKIILCQYCGSQSNCRPEAVTRLIVLTVLLKAGEEGVLLTKNCRDLEIRKTKYLSLLWETLTL